MGKKHAVGICSLLGALGCILALGGCGQTEQTQTEATIEAGEEFVFSAADFFDVEEEEVEEFEIDLSGLDTSKVGDYELPVTYEEESFTITVHVVDTVAPEITECGETVFINDPESLDAEEVGAYEDVTACTAQIQIEEKVSDPDAQSDEELMDLLEEKTAAEAEEESADAGEEAGADSNDESETDPEDDEEDADSEEAEDKDDSEEDEDGGDDQDDEADAEDQDEEEDSDGQEDAADTEDVDEQSSESSEPEEISLDSEGIYYALYQVTDEGENVSSQEFLVIYDETAPEISGLEDCTVEAGDSGEDPEVSTDSISIKDEMDGEIELSEAEVTIEEADGENQYTLTVSCTDRCGNAAEESCTLTVEEEEEEEETESSDESTSESSGSGDSGSGSSGSGSSGSSSGSSSSSSSSSSGSSSSSSSSSSNASPSWVSDLDIAQSASQMILVSASGSTATVTMHTKSSGTWTQILSTSGYIGKNGLGKTKEGDGKTPVGVYHFTKAFGVNSNPGTSLSYTQVDSSYYWVDDSDSKYYNQFVSTNSVTKDWDSAEQITAYPTAYAYVLALDYNSSCTAGKGSAIFLHCSTGNATAGCISIPTSDMVTVMKNVTSGCVIVIDSSSNIKNY